MKKWKGDRSGIPRSARLAGAVSGVSLAGTYTPGRSIGRPHVPFLCTGRVLSRKNPSPG